jgi:hypothetical protein
MSTSLTVRQVRTQILHEALLRCPDLERIEDLPDVLPYFANWDERCLGAAIDDLVADGLIVEACDGRLVVKRRRLA